MNRDRGKVAGCGNEEIEKSWSEKYCHSKVESLTEEHPLYLENL